MNKQRRSVIKDANRVLPASVSDDFISSLDSTLGDDPSVYAFYQKKYWLTKYCQLDADSAERRRQAAITKWLGIEERNRATSDQLSDIGYLESTLVDNRSVNSYIQVARRIVREVLGDNPSLDAAYAAFSGGASTSRQRAQGHPALKFLGRVDSTREAWSVADNLLRGTRFLAHISTGLEPRMVPGSCLFTVPKNSEIDRVACKEPDINVYFQKMFGNQIRFLLRRRGIDLNDQGINGQLARRASIDGSLATLDLSAASDSVTTPLVQLLLPYDWFYYLDSFRVKETSIDGNPWKLNMFSSMGNGFTFELESLIFYALARSVCYLCKIRGKIGIYGDDIIVPTEAATRLVELLSTVGFKINSEKSFIEGPFRESCGAYYHAGINVKPFFLKGPIQKVSDLIKVLNQLAAWASRLGNVVDPVYGEIHRKFRAFVPESLWGGQDLTSITSLVTGDAPRKELKPVRTQRRFANIGGYLHWLQTTALRTNPDFSVAVIGSVDTRMYRTVKNRQPRRDLPLFLYRYNSNGESESNDVEIKTTSR